MTSSTSTPTVPALRVGNMSGFYGDRISAMREMLSGGELDVLTGDYLAELTMLILGRDRMKSAELGYAKTFLRQLEDCLALALEKKVTIVANAGGVNPAALADAIRELAARQGLPAKVAHVEGDDLIGRIGELDVPSDAGFPVTANAYLGAFGIARCLDAGADVVVTGRVTDASVIVGPAISHFGWGRDDLDALAGATAAGHVIECGTQATGGNYAFFNRGEIPDPVTPGFPIAEIAADGTSVITKHAGTGGAVTVGTVTSQLLYEVTGARYGGPDVVTRLDTAVVEQEGPDRVRISGVVGETAPLTTKVSVTCLGGFRNEITFLLTGLDIEDKAALVERQFRAGLEREPEQLDFRLQRTDHPDADTQAAATAMMTIVAWDPDSDVVGRAFSDAAVAMTLSSYPGATPSAPPGRGGPYGVYIPAYLDQTEVPHIAVLPDGTRVDIDPPAVREEMGDGHASDGLDAEGNPLGPSGPVTGPTTRRPLGDVLGARSGDKGGTANIGLWAGDAEAYAWMRDTLTVDEVRRLLPEAADLPIERYELPKLGAVNFVIDGLLGKGVAHGYRWDPQAKGLAEWLRSRVVDIPDHINAPVTAAPAHAKENE
ncbi:acyclic terpene utilization AtuA family protein [Dietzia maris]|uniref:Acyclic terpene utilization AtuA family protein n=1 Tax=Dietzia maris TaxID=37915 RepID=A0AAE4QUH9_9ACTN|nr:acyclic terpene utilization AtuA family protein [Dietzia maris]MDV6298340.1 acyclic terpene utilization AtuA family protein [Dietzia maris]